MLSSRGPGWESSVTHRLEREVVSHGVPQIREDSWPGYCGRGCGFIGIQLPGAI